MSEATAVQHGAFGRAALYRLDKPIITHAHREGHLIFFVGGHSADVRMGDASLPVTSEAAVAVGPWEPHSFWPRGGVCLCLVLYIKPMWFLEASRSPAFGLSFGVPHIVVTPSLADWVHRLTAVLLDEDSAERFDGYLYETARRCLDQSWHGAAARVPLMGACNRFTDYRVRRSLRLMQEQFATDLEMHAVAQVAGLSRPHFFKLFKKQMGITPNLYLNTLRSEQAIKDLLTSDKSVTDIGYDLGFSSQASFTRFFSSNVGIPPSDYRRVAHSA